MVSLQQSWDKSILWLTVVGGQACVFNGLTGRDKRHKGKQEMDVFALRSYLIEGCGAFAQSFFKIRARDLRAQLDANDTRLYGLDERDLCYIPDPADIMDKDSPSQTFPALKNREQRHPGEYRTRRLVLESWARLQTGDLH